jgi:hypothetical protein
MVNRPARPATARATTQRRSAPNGAAGISRKCSG